MTSCTLLLVAFALFDTQAGGPMPAEQMAPAAQRVLDATRAEDEDARLRAWIAQGGRMRVAVAAGATPRDEREPLALEALSHSFIAALALRLCEEGKLQLEQPLGEIMGGLDPGIAAGNLLDAVGGRLRVPLTPALADAAAEARDHASWAALFKPAGPLRSGHDPDDASWAIAARACEIGGGATLMELLHQKVFAPLELVATVAAPRKERPDCIELPYSRPYSRPGLSPRSSVELLSSPQELAQWMQILLERRLLSDASTRRYMNPLPLADGNSSHCGLGIAQSKVAGLKRYRMASARGARQLELSFWSGSGLCIVVEAEALDLPIELVGRRLALELLQARQKAEAPVAHDPARAALVAGRWNLSGREFELVAGATALELVEAGRRLQLIPLASGAWTSPEDPEARWIPPGGGEPARELIVERGGYPSTARRAP
ncbi:MAG: Beta-lactamase [Planctomycetota bacterium]